MSEAGKADYLVTGDKSGLLRLRAASHDRGFQLRQFGSDQHVSYMIVF
jgi:predicted nucleic acid-binding protein